MEIRARLKTEAAVRRSQGLDEPIIRVDGTIVETMPDAVAIDVLIARSSSALQDVVLRDTVRVEKAEIESMLVRKLSPTRTALFTAGVAAAGVAVVLGIDQVVGGTGDDGDGGNPNFRNALVGRRTRILIGIPIR
jgi:hypothetical protein